MEILIHNICSMFWSCHAYVKDVEPGKKSSLVKLGSLIYGQIGHERTREDLFVNQHHTSFFFFPSRKCYLIDGFYPPTLLLIRYQMKSSNLTNSQADLPWIIQKWYKKPLLCMWERHFPGCSLLCLLWIAQENSTKPCHVSSKAPGNMLVRKNIAKGVSRTGVFV